MYIRTWNPVTKEISKDTDQPWYKFDYCNYAEEPIKAYFGYQTHIEDSWVSPSAVAMDGGVIIGDALRACINGKDIVEVKSKRSYFEE
jgi:hypothetical protein